MGTAWILALLGYRWRSPQGKGVFASFPQNTATSCNESAVLSSARTALKPPWDKDVLGKALALPLGYTVGTDLNSLCGLNHGCIQTPSPTLGPLPCHHICKDKASYISSALGFKTHSQTFRHSHDSDQTNVCQGISKKMHCLSIRCV